MAILMLVPFGIISFAVNAGASDADMKAEAKASNPTSAVQATAQSTGTATITGKVVVTFTFNNDGKIILKQGDTEAMSVEINADGTYTLSAVPAGDYDLIVSIPGWTDYKLMDVNVADGDSISVYETPVYAGDVNKDGIISVDDVSAAVLDSNYGVITSELVNPGADVNHDGSVSVGDVSTILLDANYAKTAQSSYFLNNGWSNFY
jgi:hypothetical protein